ncbi:GTP-binding protein [Apostasia shenzhenica]|uniref:GTP-binding protein n=1 Tax=Apostasia shenzhenica TaxID=1088818 RepID=A0A2I0AK85_9ASPA|nr:GTP-binding protein [Apostasia shenzhenica]
MAKRCTLEDFNLRAYMAWRPKVDSCNLSPKGLLLMEITPFLIPLARKKSPLPSARALVNADIFILLINRFAHASESARTDWSSFTKGYFLNRDTLVAVLLLVDASIPPQQIDLDCANWLGRNNIGMTFVFTKCDKTKAGKGSRPADNIKQFQVLIRANYREPPPWIMTSSVTGLGRDELLLHMSQSDLGQISDTRVQPSLIHDEPGPSLVTSSSMLQSGACHNQVWFDRAVPRTRRFFLTCKSRVRLPLCAPPSSGTLSFFLRVSWDPLHPTSTSYGAFIETLERWRPECAEPTPLLAVRMRENLPFGHQKIGLRPQLLGVTPNLLPPLGEPVSQNFRGCWQFSLTWSLASQPNRP